MGVRPSAADIARYNAWAHSEGEPAFGSNVAPAGAPAPPAAPVPPARPPRRGGWQRGRARGLHGAVEPDRQEADDRWIRGDWYERNKVYARMASGRHFVIRTRNRNGEDIVTPKGRDYYDHNRQEFVIKIPVMGYKDSRHGPVECFVTYIPLTQAYFDGLRDLDYHHELQGLLGAGRVRDRLSTRAEIEAAIKDAVHLYLSRLTETDTMGRKVIIHASSIYYVFDDTRPILFDEQVVRHIRHDGTPVIEYILNRPLLGMPVMPPNMCRKLGLCEIATYDLRAQGGCI